MKTLLIIIFILTSIDSFSQIKSNEDWPTSIQREFNLFKKQNIDTFLIYYSSLGPWAFLPDSCKDIPAVWIVWIKDNKHYARELLCDSPSHSIKPISPTPIKYFVSHIKDFKLKDKYLKEKTFLPPIPTDGSWEYLILMTSKKSIYLNLSEHQRTDKIWNRFAWIKPTIKAIDTFKHEVYINKNER